MAAERAGGALSPTGCLVPVGQPPRALPLEYAVEMNRLIQLQMEGSVG